MKRIIYSIFAVASLLAGCSDNVKDENNVDESVKSVFASVSDVKFDMTEDQIPQTRMTVNWDNSNVVSFRWGYPEYIAVFPQNPNERPQPDPAATNNQNDGEASSSYRMESKYEGQSYAKFYGSGFNMINGNVYYAMSPYIREYDEEKNEWKSNISTTDKTNIEFSYKGQVQDGNGSLAHLGRYNYMASAANALTGGLSLNFKRVSAILRFRFAFDNITGPINLTKFELKTQDDYDFNNLYYRTIDITYSDSADYENTPKEVKHYSPRSFPAKNLPATKATSFEMELKNVVAKPYKSNNANLVVLYVTIPATNELVGKKLYAEVTDDHENKYTAALNVVDYVPGMAKSYGAIVADASTLSLGLHVIKDWQLGTTENLTRAKGDPGVKDKFLEPDNLYIYTCIDGKVATDPIQIKYGDSDWKGWKENDTEFLYDGRITVSYTQSVTNYVKVYMIASKGELFTSSVAKGNAESVVQALTYDANTQEALKNVYAYTHTFGKDELKIAEAKLYHAAAKMDVQWNAVNPLKLTSADATSVISINNVPSKGLKFFEPWNNAGTTLVTYKDNIDAGNMYNGRSVFYVPQLGSNQYSITSGKSGSTLKTDNVTFSPSTQNDWTTWFKVNIKQ